MSTRAAHVLGTLRRRRRVVAAALLPALLAYMATGSACLAMTPGTPAPEAHAVHKSHAHAASHTDHHAAHPSASPDAPCPHCPAGGTAAVSVHACAAPDATAAHLQSTPQPDAKPLLLGADWVPPPSAPAPPLIPFAAWQRGAVTRDVPLNILHCVLLI